MSEEWGPWIEHDNSGMPEGLTLWTIVQADLSGDILSPMPAGDLDWRHPDAVTRYRIRKPRGLVILESLLTNLPETVDA